MVRNKGPEVCLDGSFVLEESKGDRASISVFWGGGRGLRRQMVLWCQAFVSLFGLGCDQHKTFGRVYGARVACDEI